MRDYEDVLAKPTELAALMKDRAIECIALGLAEPTSDRPDGGLVLALHYSAEKSLLEEAADEADIAELFSIEQQEIFNDSPRIVGGILRLNDEGQLFTYGIGGGGSAPSLTERLRHMLDCIHTLKSHLSLIDERRFTTKNPTPAELAVIDAIIWQLARFGEACAAVPREEWASHSGIDFRGYKALRNKLIHQYFHTSLRRVWQEAKRCVSLEQALLTSIAAQESKESR